MRRLLILMCTFLGLTLLGMHAVPALLPLFVEMWSLSNTEAGWIAGIPYLTYPTTFANCCFLRAGRNTP
ncbi:MAG: hypothetical protein QGF20_03715 [Alphaproteobacteria bacterium]|jgi:hypothetical protein|nr:hypothetical protein [Alphaproteobacteria bacterium]